MVINQCDSCGKVFVVKDKASWNPNIYYFVNFNFCEECYKMLESKWEDALHSCNHDMNLFKQKKVEVAKSMCDKSKSTSKKK